MPISAVRTISATPWHGIISTLREVPLRILSHWKQLLADTVIPLDLSGLTDLVVCPVVILEYVAGTHLLGPRSGSAYSQQTRDRAPLSCLLLKAHALADTLNFGSITWSAGRSDPRLKRILEHFSLGEERMRASEDALHFALLVAFRFLWTEQMGSECPAAGATPSATSPAIADAENEALAEQQPGASA